MGMYALISRKYIINIRWFKYVHIFKIDNNTARENKVKNDLIPIGQYLVDAVVLNFNI